MCFTFWPLAAFKVNRFLDLIDTRNILQWAALDPNNQNSKYANKEREKTDISSFNRIQDKRNSFGKNIFFLKNGLYSRIKWTKECKLYRFLKFMTSFWENNFSISGKLYIITVFIFKSIKDGSGLSPPILHRIQSPLILESWRSWSNITK